MPMATLQRVKTCNELSIRLTLKLPHFAAVLMLLETTHYRAYTTTMPSARAPREMYVASFYEYANNFFMGSWGAKEHGVLHLCDRVTEYTGEYSGKRGRHRVTGYSYWDLALLRMNYINR